MLVECAYASPSLTKTDSQTELCNRDVYGMNARRSTSSSSPFITNANLLLCNKTSPSSLTTTFLLLQSLQLAALSLLQLAVTFSSVSNRNQRQSQSSFLLPLFKLQPPFCSVVFLCSRPPRVSSSPFQILSSPLRPHLFSSNLLCLRSPPSVASTILLSASAILRPDAGRRSFNPQQSSQGNQELRRNSSPTPPGNQKTTGNRVCSDRDSPDPIAEFEPAS